MKTHAQDLTKFALPRNFRGRSAFVVQIWWVAQALLFRTSPQFAYGFRRWLLRMFGAKIGARVLIRPTAEITYPWKLTVGDYAWIGDDVVLYTLGPICIGRNSVVSQRSYLCAADHDYRMIDFPIRAREIHIGESCWLAADVFVGPGVSISDSCVVGARSSVFGNLPSDVVCVGNPARVVRPRSRVEQ